MPDSFHIYLKKQLVEYIENERKKGVPLDEIEKVLLNAGHDKNIIDEVISDLKKIDSGKEEEKNGPVEKDLSSMLKDGFAQFMAKSREKYPEKIDGQETEKIVKEAIEEAEVIEEKTMFEGMGFFLYLVALAGIIAVTTSATDSQIVNVALGLAPAIISVFISFIALPLADNVPVYVFIPVVTSSLFYGVGRFSGLSVFQGLEMEALSLVNFVLAFIFNIMIVYIRFIKPSGMKRRLRKKKPSADEPMPLKGGLKREFKIDPEKKKDIDELRQGFVQ